MKIRPYLLTLLCWSIAFCSHAQDNAGCKSELKNVLKALSDVNAEVPKGKLYYLDYEVKATLRGEQNDAGKERIRALFADNEVMVLSNYMEIYADGQHTFTVLPKQKKVLWSNATKGYGTQFRQQYGLQIQDSLFAYSTVIKCEMEEWNGKNLRKVALQCSARGKQALNLEQVTFWHDPKSLELKRVAIDYAKRGNIEQMDVTFKSIEYDYRGELKMVNFAKKYLSGDRLNSGKYNGYELQDLRKKASRN